MAIDVKLAVLIDGDNISHSLIEHVLKEVEQFGQATVKRIYGDFSSPQKNKVRNFVNGLLYWRTW